MNLTHMALSAAEEEQSFFGALWQYFYDTYLFPSEYYEHLGIDGSGILSVRMIILGLFVGICIAMFAAVYNKRTLGGIVRTVLSAEALSRESALTLEQLGIEKSAIARYSVAHSVTLRRVLKCREEQDFTEEQNAARDEYQKKRENDRSLPRFKETEYKVNPYADAFYIPVDMKYMAEIKFDKKGTSLAGAFIFCAIMLVAFIVIMVALPELLGFIDGIVGAL